MRWPRGLGWTLSRYRTSLLPSKTSNEVVAGRAAIIALGAGSRGKLQPKKAGTTIGAGRTALFHSVPQRKDILARTPIAAPALRTAVQVDGLTRSWVKDRVSEEGGCTGHTKAARLLYLGLLRSLFIVRHGSLHLVTPLSSFECLQRPGGQPEQWRQTGYERTEAIDGDS